MFQYALYCVTRLADEYKQHLFPDIPMSFGSFREDIQDYLALCHELFNDLALEERLVPNSRVSEAHDVCAKSALSELALECVVSSEDLDSEIMQDIRDTVVLVPTLNLQPEEAATNSTFDLFYEDTLKMIITDFERKDIWQHSTLFSNEVGI